MFFLLNPNFLVQTSYMLVEVHLGKFSNPLYIQITAEVLNKRTSCLCMSKK